jgi:hypothetical protein
VPSRRPSRSTPPVWFVNLLPIPGQPELQHACVQNISRLRAECDSLGMPVMVEPLAMQAGDSGYGVDGDPEKIVASAQPNERLNLLRAARQGDEAGDDPVAGETVALVRAQLLGLLDDPFGAERRLGVSNEFGPHRVPTRIRYPPPSWTSSV